SSPAKTRRKSRCIGSRVINLVLHLRRKSVNASRSASGRSASAPKPKLSFAEADQTAGKSDQHGNHGVDVVRDRCGAQQPSGGIDLFLPIAARPQGGSTSRKTRMHTRLSCKIDYLLRSNHRDRSIASEFFTDDYLFVGPGDHALAPARAVRWD